MAQNLTYRDSGVDIDAGNALVENIKPLAAATQGKGALGSLGGFGALFELPLDRYRKPLLVSGTDGVGTKLRFAIEYNALDGLGIDLVAMCVNDIAVTGAEVLFFLDYYATSALDVDSATRVISGIAEGCKLADCALSGGETAEMPGLYKPGDFDLAGFAVGIVEKDAVIDGTTIQAGDAVVGLASSGVHSNGFSLINRIRDDLATNNQQQMPDDIAQRLLQPTRIYTRSALAATRQVNVKGIAHITGGGLPENLPRVLPEQLAASIDTNSWQRSPEFDWIRKTGNVSPAEMYRVFNCGIGMVMVVAPEDTSTLLASLSKSGETAMVIGEIVPHVDFSTEPSASSAQAGSSPTASRVQLKQLEAF